MFGDLPDLEQLFTSSAVAFVLMTAALCIWAPWWVWCWPAGMIGIVVLALAREVRK